MDDVPLYRSLSIVRARAPSNASRFVTHRPLRDRRTEWSMGNGSHPLPIDHCATRALRQWAMDNGRRIHCPLPVVIPSSVTQIGTSAFAKCSSLASVVIPKSLEAHKDNAFPGYTGEFIVSA